MINKRKLEKLLKDFEKEISDPYPDKKADAFFRIGVIKSLLDQDPKECITKIFEVMPYFMEDRMEDFLTLYELEQVDNPELGILSMDREEWKPHFCKLMIVKYFGVFQEEFEKAYPFIEEVFARRKKYY